MTNAERIKALRNCSDGFCSLCPYDDYELSTKECEAKLMLDAADALEAAEKRIAIVEEERDLERFAAKNYLDKIDELEKELEIWTVRSFEGKIGRMAFINLNLKKEISELKALLPKEGEWLDETDGRYFWHGKCSICNHEYNIDSYYGDMNYCPNCGARMKLNDKQKTESENTKSSLEYDYCGTLKRRYDIEAQLPKEGEWMTNIRWDYQQPTQTTATNVGTTFMCRSTGKLCPNATEYGYCKQTVCNSCDYMKQEVER